MRRMLFALLFAAVMTEIVNAAPARIDAELERQLQAFAPDTEVAVIIRFTGIPDLRVFKDLPTEKKRESIIRALRRENALSEQTLRAFLLRKPSRGLKSLWLINGFGVRVPARLVNQLSRLQGIESISLDATLAAPQPQAGTSAPPEWNLTMLGAQQLWQQGFTGQGMVVATMDTGVDAMHPDIGPK